MSNSLFEDVNLRKTAGRLYSEYLRSGFTPPSSFAGTLFDYAFCVAVQSSESYYLSDSEIFEARMAGARRASKRCRKDV